MDPDAACQTDSGGLIICLYLVIRKHRCSLARLLVAHGADLRAHAPVVIRPGPGRRTALRAAATASAVNIRCCVEDTQAIDGALETLELLLAAGADVDAFDGRRTGDQSSDETAWLQA